MSTQDKDNAESQARAQVASITEMVAALSVDYDRLEELRDERTDDIDQRREDYPDMYQSDSDASDAWRAANPKDWAELEELEAAAGECTSEDEARERIQEDALSVEVRSSWETLGEALTPSEFRIVLCTGGPHVEIVGDLNQYNEPASVRVIYKDWGTSGELFGFDHEPVLTYCQQFYFGE